MSELVRCLREPVNEEYDPLWDGYGAVDIGDAKPGVNFYDAMMPYWGFHGAEMSILVYEDVII
jgi:hypothetical protein